MVGKIQVTALILVFFAILPSAHGALKMDQVLVNFGFDDGRIALDERSFKTWEQGRGSVKTTTHASYSGYRSLEIKDQASDKSFPELQGYFSKQTAGKLFVRFALLIDTPNEELNIALVGPAGFGLKKDGIALWLSTKNGWLYHTTDSIPTKLFSTKPHRWYIFKLMLDIDRGRYDLQVAEEKSEKPFLRLSDQINATNQPGSSVDKLSFIGDKGDDTSNVSYLIDDVLVGSTKNVLDQPFAPSTPHRTYFIDGWYELKKSMSAKPRCPDVFDISDFGIQSNERAEINRLQYAERVRAAVVGRKPFAVGNELSQRTHATLTALNRWVSGCLALKADSGKVAEEDFRFAMNLVPDARIYGLAFVLSLAAQKQWESVNQEMALIYSDWIDDPRFDLALAVIGIARSDLAANAKVLEKFTPQLLSDLRADEVKELWLGGTSGATVTKIKTAQPSRWKEILSQPQIAEQYFYSLIWQNKAPEAGRFAERIVRELKAAHASAGFWEVLLGDANFYASEPRAALAHYLEALKDAKQAQNPDLMGRISDAYFSLNDADGELKYRAKRAALIRSNSESPH